MGGRMGSSALLLLLLHSLSGVEGQESVAAPQAPKDNATLYHYFPHNQHLFQLPDCASQQVCNAVYLRLNFSIPLCACPAPGDPCSASTLATDGHSLGLQADQASGKVLTLAKTCEEVKTIRTCDQNRDWSILALQNIRTGKAHYLVICTCPDTGFLEGPLAQTGAPYAKVPGIRVYGMLCLARGTRRQKNRPKRRKARLLQEQEVLPHFPEVPQHLWDRARGQ